MKRHFIFHLCSVILLGVSLLTSGCDKEKLGHIGEAYQLSSRTPDRLDVPMSDMSSKTEFRERSLEEYYTLNVAVLLPLSGPYAQLGGALQKAAQMALFDRGSKELNLMFIDTHGSPEGAVAAFEEAVKKDVHLVVGPLFSQEVNAVKDLARNRKINVVSFSTDKYAAGKGIFIMGFLPEQVVERSVRYAYSRGKRNFAIFAPQNEYGERVVAHVTRVLNSYSEDAPQPVFYKDRSAVGLNNAVKELAAKMKKDTDVILIPEGGQALQDILPLLPYYDINTLQIKLLGSGQWNVPELRDEVVIRGGWFAAPSLQGQRRFNERYRERYQQNPPAIASLAYDAVSLAASIAAKTHGSKNSAKIYSLLIQRNGYYGVDGLFRFDPSGIVDRGLSVVEITREGMITIDHAPTSFDEKY